jgi:hypothetical protein
VASGRLRVVPVRDFKVERTIWLVRHRDRQLPRPAQAFVALVTMAPGVGADPVTPRTAGA